MAKDDEYIPPIEITPAGETVEDQEATLEVVQPSPGFPAAARLLAEAIEKEAITTVTILDRWTVA